MRPLQYPEIHDPENFFHRNAAGGDAFRSTATESNGAEKFSSLRLDYVPGSAEVTCIIFSIVLRDHVRVLA